MRVRRDLRVVWLALAAAFACSGPVPTVERVIIVNPTAYDVNVDVRAKGRPGWSMLGEARHDAETPFHEVVDQGTTWVVRFSYGGIDGGEITLPRRRMAGNRWRIEIPEEVAERLAEHGIAPPP